MSTRLAANPAETKVCGQEVADGWLPERRETAPFDYRFNPCFVGADVQGRDFSELLLGFDDDAQVNGRNSNSYWVWAANFSEVNAAGANFDRTDLYAASFVNAVLSGTTFRGADLRGVGFTGATGLDPALLEGALYDRETVWPEGFDPQSAPGLRQVQGKTSAWLRAKDRDPNLAERMKKSVRKWW